SGVAAWRALPPSRRRGALAAVARGGGFFDCSFCAYYEDVDLSLRLARAGFRFACDPAAKAWHEGSRTGRRVPFRRALWTSRNRWRTLFRNFDSGFLARGIGSLLRPDLAHFRDFGWKGWILLLVVWPSLPWLAWRSRPEGTPLTEWPSPTKSALAS